MKIKLLAVAIGAIGLSLAAGSAMAFYGGTSENPKHFQNFQFDKAEGERFHSSGYYPNTNEDICGKATSIDQSPSFGKRSEYKDLYHTIGQMHAELSQIRVVGSEPTEIAEEIIASAKEQIDFGIELKNKNKQDISESAERHPGQAEQFLDMIEDSDQRTAEAIENVNKNAMETILAMMNHYKSERPQGMMGMSHPQYTVLEEWTLCRALWNQEIEANYRLKHLEDAIRGVDRVK